MLDLAVAVPTLVGSYLSMLAAGSVFMCYLILPAQKHYRHTLIWNLAGADFFNALNNSISGTYAIAHKGIPAGSACTINGWVGQLTVQATDFTILFITIATVITLRKQNHKPRTDLLTKRIITCCIWIVPLTTSGIAFYLDAYRPATGNWCWIAPKPVMLRYALGHIWRLTIIFATISLYIYLFVYIHRHFASLRAALEPQSRPTSPDNMSQASDDSFLSGITIHEEFEIVEEPFDAWWDNQIPLEEMKYFDLQVPVSSLPQIESTKRATYSPPPSPLKVIMQRFVPNRKSLYESGYGNARESSPLLKTRDPLAIVRRAPSPTNGTTTTAVASPAAKSASLWTQEVFIQKLLLLNAYPIAYVLLWIPGIANRFVELMGYKLRWLVIAQASTQFVGLANALVYGYNERIWSMTKLWWKSKRENVNIDKQETGSWHRGSDMKSDKSSTYKSPFRSSSVPYISRPIQ